MEYAELNYSIIPEVSGMPGNLRSCELLVLARAPDVGFTAEATLWSCAKSRDSISDKHWLADFQGAGAGPRAYNKRDASEGKHQGRNDNHIAPHRFTSMVWFYLTPPAPQMASRLD